jgi:hypothetical protein
MASFYKKHTYSFLLILFSLLLLTAGYFYLTLFKKDPLPSLDSNLETATSTEKLNFKKYTNTFLGFQFEYPASLGEVTQDRDGLLFRHLFHFDFSNFPVYEDGAIAIDFFNRTILDDYHAVFQEGMGEGGYFNYPEKAETVILNDPVGTDCLKTVLQGPPTPGFYETNDHGNSCEVVNIYGKRALKIVQGPSSKYSSSSKLEYHFFENGNWIIFSQYFDASDPSDQIGYQPSPERFNKLNSMLRGGSLLNPELNRKLEVFDQIIASLKFTHK